MRRGGRFPGAPRETAGPRSGRDGFHVPFARRPVRGDAGLRIRRSGIQAIDAGADIIMLDNMDDDMLKEAIAYIDHRAEIEVSGNVTKENIARLTNLGVDYVSSGALTHSAPILDLSLKNLHVL